MDQKSFEAAYSLLNKKAQGRLRNEIIRRCGWRSRTTFYNKLYGGVEIPALEMGVFEEELKKEKENDSDDEPSPK